MKYSSSIYKDTHYLLNIYLFLIFPPIKMRKPLIPQNQQKNTMRVASCATNDQTNALFRMSLLFLIFFSLSTQRNQMRVTRGNCIVYRKTYAQTFPPSHFAPHRADAPTKPAGATNHHPPPQNTTPKLEHMCVHTNPSPLMVGCGSIVVPRIYLHIFTYYEPLSIYM